MTVTINGTTGVTTNNSIYTDASGNTGIGTTSPTQKLHVYTASGSIYGLIQSGASATNAGLILSQGNNTYYHITDAAGWQLFDNTSTQLRVGTSGNFQFNSGYGSAAVAYGCRAWVNFNGTGTVAIRSSGNVSSITDNTTGNYTVNLTNAMPDTNYTVVASANGQGSTQVAAMPMTSAFAPSAPSTSAFRVFTAYYTAAIDCEYIHASVFR